MAKKDPLTEFAPQIRIGSSNQITLEEVQKLAAERSYPELADFDPHDFPMKSTERAALQTKMRILICEVLRDAASGKLGTEGYQLSDEPEPFFQTARTVAREKEVTSQADAIRRLLRIKPEAPIVLSELDLVNAAVRIAKEQNRQAGYKVEDLIREGIRMAAQSIISKGVAADNSEGRGPDNLPGASDVKYLEALNELRALRADPEKWIAAGFRKKEITVSLLARRAGTNDVQIRNFLARHGYTDVLDPKTVRAAKVAEVKSK